MSARDSVGGDSEKLLVIRKVMSIIWVPDLTLLIQLRRIHVLLFICRFKNNKKGDGGDVDQACHKS